MSTKIETTLHGQKAVLDGRYYHFVAIQKPKKDWYSKFWSEIGRTSKPNNSIAIPFTNEFDITWKKLRSKDTGARGKMLDIVSHNGAGDSPYYHDVFTLRAQQNSEVISLFGFSFARVAADTTLKTMGKKSNSLLGRFCKCNIPKLVRILDAKRERKESTDSPLLRTMHVSIVANDTLSEVRLGGAKPLDSEIYQEFLKKRPSETWLPDYLAVSFQRNNETNDRILRTRLHMDKHGNFKFYVHNQLSNVSLICNIFQWLVENECLENAIANPTLKIGEEDLAVQMKG